MNYSHKAENREFTRINTKLSSEFKLIGNKSEYPNLGFFSNGTIASLSGGGAMLEGPLTDIALIPKLIMQKIIVGVKFNLDDAEDSVAALCRVAWINGAVDNSKEKNSIQFGLMFREISLRDRDRIFKFVIHNQMQG